ncbi:molybdate ABC transporter permease subunit [Shewanella sp.]|uniref:molybdate ABC transporter permease subunit n=1 Tax=Shewanella sp. TaxID=50422 RepID=UPI003A97BE0F
MSLLTEYEVVALTLSLKVALTAVCASLPLGILAAWVLARCNFPGKSLLDGIIHLPLVLPPVVVGYLLLVSMGRSGWLGAWLYKYLGISFSFSWRGAALAAAVVAFPLMVRAIRQAFEAVDTRLELAARTLGAGRLKVFFTISLPLTAPGIVSGMVLAFARCLGEFGSTITFVSNIPGETRTIPLAMYSFIETPGAEAQAARLCVIAIVISLVSLVASQWLGKRVQLRANGQC